MLTSRMDLSRLFSFETGDNKADVFTKNIVRELYNKHTNDMVWKAEEMNKSVKK